jgi:hypothetical protein
VIAAHSAQRGQPQPKAMNHGFHGFHGLRILHPRRPRNGIETEVNEANEEEFRLRFLRSLLFRRNPCHPPSVVKIKVSGMFVKEMGKAFSS